MGDDGTVVQRRVLEEERLDEGARSKRIDSLAGVDELLHFVLPLEDDQGAGFRLRHVHAGVDVGFIVDRLAGVHVVAPELEALPERLVELRLGAEEEKKLAYLGLEDDYQGDEPDTGDGTQDGT